MQLILTDEVLRPEEVVPRSWVSILRMEEATTENVASVRVSLKTNSKALSHRESYGVQALDEILPKPLEISRPSLRLMS